MSRSLALCDQLLAFSLEPNGLKGAKRDVRRSEERFPFALVRGARSLPEGRRHAPRERERARDQARGRGRIRPSREPVRRQAQVQSKRKRRYPVLALVRGARSLPEGRRHAPRERERARDQARGRGRIRPSREPVRRQAQVQSKRKRRYPVLALVRGARSLPEGRRRAPRERERARDQARGRAPLSEPRAGAPAGRRSRVSGSDGQLFGAAAGFASAGASLLASTWMLSSTSSPTTGAPFSMP